MPDLKPDPICGFCLAKGNTPSPVQWDAERRAWVCPSCGAVNPVCGFCIVRLEIRPRLTWDPGRRGWLCPVCGAVTHHPSDPDATAADLAVMFVEGASQERDEQFQREWYSKPRVFERGPIEPKGNKKAGRRKKKRLPTTPWYRRFGQV